MTDELGSGVARGRDGEGGGVRFRHHFFLPGSLRSGSQIAMTSFTL